MEISEIRRRLKHRIDQTRRVAAERQQQNDAAARAYEHFRANVATPIFKQFAAALRAEGHHFQVFTPADGLRLASERSGEDFIEVLLDVSGDRPIVLGRVSYSRGSRVLSHEVPLGSGQMIDQLTEEDVVRFLLDEIAPFISR
jgi:hypothetical protein